MVAVEGWFIDEYCRKGSSLFVSTNRIQNPIRNNVTSIKNEISCPFWTNFHASDKPR